jgi:HEAT repeat protein
LLGWRSMEVPVLRRVPLALTILAAGLALGCLPTGARDLSSLTSPEASTRARAVAKLGKAARPEAFPALIARVGDPDPTVRANVAVALGHYESLPSVEALSDLTGDSTEAVQLAAVDALGGLMLAQAQAQLLRAYLMGTSSVRAEVASVLRATHRAPQLALESEARELWQRLSQELTRGRLEERVGAAEELGRSGKPQAVERLTEYLGADPPRLAAGAIRGLGATRSPSARAPLEAVLNSDNPDLQAAAAQALGALGIPEAGGALAGVAARGGSLGRIALDAMEALGAKGVEAALCGAALCDDPEVALRAASLVRAAGSECDPKPFLARLGRDRSAVGGALAALAEIPHEVSAAELRRIRGLLGSGPGEVRALAARAAGGLGLEDLTPELASAFAGARDDLAVARQHWVEGPLDPLVAGSGTAAPPAARRDRLFASDPPDAVALVAQSGEALVRLHATDSVRIEGELAGDPSPIIRIAAAEGLRYLPSSEATPHLSRLLEDPDARVRLRALEVLPHVLEGAPASQLTAFAGQLLASMRRLAEEPPVTELALQIEALGKLGGLCARASACGTDIQKALDGALRAGGTAAAAASAIGFLPDHSAGELLLERLRERPSAGLPELVAAVAEREAGAAQTLLRPLLFHTRPGVRAAAAHALLNLGSSEIQEDVQALRADYFVAVREAVTEGEQRRKGL